MYFKHPVFHLAAVIRGVEKDFAMGVGPKELRNRRLHGRRFAEIVQRPAPVVGERRNRNQKNTYAQCHTAKKFPDHAKPRIRWAFH
jgi:hypothetical protein